MKKIITFFAIILLFMNFSGCTQAKQQTTLSDADILNAFAPYLSESDWDYEQDFSNLEEINNDFASFYLKDFMGMQMTEQVSLQSSELAHWVLGDKEVYRQGDIRGEDGMKNYAMLFLKTRRYANFKMQFDLIQGDATNYFATFNIRTEELGKHFFGDGEAYYVQHDGALVTWGHGMHGGPFLLGNVKDYSQSQWTTYTVTVSGNYMITEINGQSYICVLPARFYRFGYISFFSINNNMRIRNLKVKALPDSSVILSDFPFDNALPSSDAEDSLDVLGGMVS